MHNKVQNIFQDKNLNIFSSQSCDVIKSALELFWEQDAKVILQGVNDYREIRDEKLVSNIDFFSSQIKVESHKPVIIRLSKEFIENILKNTLGLNSQVFRLSAVTPLEINILNGFCEFLYKRLKDILISPSDAKLSEKSEKNINMVFVVAQKDDIISKIMISVPQDRVKFAPLAKKQNFKEDDFITSNASIRLKAGSTRITLDELQNLSEDDIVVLDNSELDKMILLSGDVQKKFNIKINPSLIVDINNDDEDEEDFNQTYEEVKMEKNVWDDIQIELNAEFEKVKMTIGELKQISQGQIIDLGSIFDNEISLFVEDRKVAKGELIIINDRYAVRLNEVLSTNTNKVAAEPKIQVQAKPQAQVNSQAQAQKPQAQAQKPQAQAKPQPQQQKPQPRPKVQVGDDEEFDYSDFEK